MKTIGEILDQLKKTPINLHGYKPGTLVRCAKTWIVEGWGKSPALITTEDIAKALLNEAKTQDGCAKYGQSIPEYPKALRNLGNFIRKN